MVLFNGLSERGCQQVIKEEIYTIVSPLVTSKRRLAGAVGDWGIGIEST